MGTEIFFTFPPSYLQYNHDLETADIIDHEGPISCGIVPTGCSQATTEALYGGRMELVAPKQSPYNRALPACLAVAGSPLGLSLVQTQKAQFWPENSESNYSFWPEIGPIPGPLRA